MRMKQSKMFPKTDYLFDIIDFTDFTTILSNEIRAKIIFLDQAN
jgi:hypothetical protein